VLIAYTLPEIMNMVPFTHSACAPGSSDGLLHAVYLVTMACRCALLAAAQTTGQIVNTLLASTASTTPGSGLCELHARHFAARCMPH
jgi:hypothetical protein